MLVRALKTSNKKRGASVKKGLSQKEHEWKTLKQMYAPRR